MGATGAHYVKLNRISQAAERQMPGACFHARNLHLNLCKHPGHGNSSRFAVTVKGETWGPRKHRGRVGNSGGRSTPRAQGYTPSSTSGIRENPHQPTTSPSKGHVTSQCPAVHPRWAFASLQDGFPGKGKSHSGVGLSYEHRLPEALTINVCSFKKQNKNRRGNI